MDVHEAREAIASQGFQQGRAKSQVWHEGIVHNIEMNEIAPGLHGRIAFFGQAGEIAGEYRGRDTGGEGHRVCPGGNEDGDFGSGGQLPIR
jgi:hypothetical protein